MSDKQKIGQFREAFKGYNKEDVNAYIQQMFHQFEERERAMLRSRKEMTASQQSPQSPIAPIPSERLEELHAQIEAKKAEIAAKTAEIEALRARVTEMEEGAGRYEKMSAQLGDIMLRARGDADRITEQAAKDAEQITLDAKVSAEEVLEAANCDAEAVRAEAQQYAETLRAEALRQADTIISYASDRMKHLYHEETEGYAKVLETLRHQTVHFTEKLSEYRESFPREVQDAQDIAKEAVRQLARSTAAQPPLKTPEQ